MLGLLIIGIAAVVVAAVVIYNALSDAKEDADNEDKFSKNKPAEQPVAPCPRELLTIEWELPATWCSEKAPIKGTTKAYGDGEMVGITVKNQDTGKAEANFDAAVSGNAFRHEWRSIDVKPEKSGSDYLEELKLDGHAADKKTPTPLKYQLLPNLPRTEYHQQKDHFFLESKNYEITIEGDIECCKGWGGQVVQLGAAVPAGTGGLLDSDLPWAGYRWMKTVGVKNQYWDGTAWKDLPAGFALIDANNFCLGFYKKGNKFTCQFGGDWPENFTDWNIESNANKAKIGKWEKNIRDTWTGKFKIKRKECQSAGVSHACCTYTTKAKAKFNIKPAVANMLIIANGNIRSNDSLFFIDEPRIVMAAHEFGHHLGNPDEYAGANVDTSLNDDGAVNGIDADSIMGQNMTKVKVRHYTTICKHFSDMAKTKTGKTWTYEAVP